MGNRLSKPGLRVGDCYTVLELLQTKQNCI